MDKVRKQRADSNGFYVARCCYVWNTVQIWNYAQYADVRDEMLANLHDCRKISWFLAILLRFGFHTNLTPKFDSRDSSGYCRYPPIELDTKKFSSQLSQYLNPVSSVAAQISSVLSPTALVQYGWKFLNIVQARRPASAEAIVPWKYCILKRYLSNHRISLSTILIVLRPISSERFIGNLESAKMVLYWTHFLHKYSVISTKYILKCGSIETVILPNINSR